MAALKTSLNPHILDGKGAVDGNAFTGKTILDFTKEVTALLNSMQDRIVPESIFAGLQRRVFESLVARHISPPIEWLRVSPWTFDGTPAPAIHDDGTHAKLEFSGTVRGGRCLIFTTKDLPLEQLRQVRFATKLNLVTVFGLPSSGKSLLLNQFVGKPDCFGQFGREAEHGLARLALVNIPKDGHQLPTKLGFVEVDSSGSWVKDLALLFPLLLVSKVVILNWAGPPDKDELLKALAELGPDDCGT